MKKIYIFLLPLVIILFVIILYLQIRGSQQVPSKQTPIVTPFESENVNSLQILTIAPSQELPYTKASRNQEIQVTFNKPVLATSVKVSANPNLALFVRQGANPKEVFISPEFPKIWEPNILYSVRIETSTTARDGSPLGREKTYILQSTVAAEPNIDEQY